MKTLKQVMGDLGGYQPKPEGEQNFVKKHVVDKKEDMNGNGDDVFKAAKVKVADRPGERHGYTDKDDDKVHGDTEWAKILKKYKVIGEESLMVSRHRNYARPGQGPEKHTITRDHGEAPDGSRVYSVKQPNGYHGVLAVKGDTVVGSSRNNLSKDQAHSLGAHYAKHGAVGIGVGTNWSLGSGIHGKVVREEVELEEKHLTPAELRKREEIAQAIHRENPGMDKGKKMAIATAQAKKIAEATHRVVATSKSGNFRKIDTVKVAEEIEMVEAAEEAELDEVNKHSFLGRIMRHHELKKKVDDTWRDAAAAEKRGDKKAADRSFEKHVRYANLERPGTWRTVKNEAVDLEEASENKKSTKGKAVMPATGVYDSIPLGITVSEESGSSIDTSLLELFVALDEEERALFIEMLESDGDLLREIAEETK